MVRRPLFRAACGAFFLPFFAIQCSPALPPDEGPGPDVSSLFGRPQASVSASFVAASSAPVASVPKAPDEPPCQTDDDCGYDPVDTRCGTSPRLNKQPPLVDQGILCYCDASNARCALLRVDPAPCEGDDSCAIRSEPRPHPVHVDEYNKYSKPPRCRRPYKGQARRVDRYVTCERTNICTMHTRECAE